jgi:hypothetical protein
MPLTIDWYNSLVKVTSPTTDVDGQTLHDFIEDAMASPRGLATTDILKPEGKIEDQNNPGVFSQIILQFNDPWQIQFWQGSGYTRIYGAKVIALRVDGEIIKATGAAGDVTVLESPVDGLTVAGAVGEAELDAIAARVWDRLLSGATHNIPGSAGRRLRDLSTSVIITGTAAGNGNGKNQIVLDNDASSVDGAYDPAEIYISNGTGSGQARGILQYDGSSKTATVDRGWKVQPDVTSEYTIVCWSGREHVNEGLAQGGTSNTITLNTLASSNDDEYVGQVIFIRSGLGEDQACRCIAYNGTTRVATIARDWNVIPDGTSGYVMLPESTLDVAVLLDSLWQHPEAVSRTVLNSQQKNT